MHHTGQRFRTPPMPMAHGQHPAQRQAKLQPSHHMWSQPCCSWKLMAMSVQNSGSCHVMIGSARACEHPNRISRTVPRGKARLRWCRPRAAAASVHGGGSSPPERVYISSLSLACCFRLIVCTRRVFPEPSSAITISPIALACCDGKGSMGTSPIAGDSPAAWAWMGRPCDRTECPR